MTKTNTRNLFASTVSAATFLVLILIFTSSSASAREHKAARAVPQSRVVAHLEFTGSPAVDMAIRKQDDGKRFLYVQHGGEQGISVVDITDPAKSRVVRTLQWPNPATSNRMNVLGNMAIISETEAAPERGRTSTGDVVVWDLSNPTDPKALQRFPGVVKVLQDDHDDVIYLLNREGLWVISAPNRPAIEETSSTSNYGG